MDGSSISISSLFTSPFANVILGWTVFFSDGLSKS